MSFEQSNWDFPQSRPSGRITAEANVEVFAAELTSILGEDLLAIMLHGPDAFREKGIEPKEYNIIVVLKEISVREIDRVASVVREWVAGGQPVPLFFSQDRLANSAATFPVELLDLKECHRLLHGLDMISSLEVRKENLLQEVERGLKTQLHRFSENRILYGHVSEQFRAAVCFQLPRMNILLRSALRFYTPQSFESIIETVRKLEIYLPGTARGILSLYVYGWGIEVKEVDASVGERALLEDAFESLLKIITSVEAIRAKQSGK
jgi:hypothetical protein